MKNFFSQLQAALIHLKLPGLLQGKSHLLLGHIPFPTQPGSGNLLLGGFTSLTLFQTETSQKGHAIVASVENALQFNLSLYQVVCSYFSFSRCWFQQVSLISVCSLISIVQAVFWGTQFAQMSGEQFEQLTCVIVFCEVNTIVVPILQRRKRKHKEVSYSLLLVNSLLTSWITCQRLHKFLVAESGFKPQTLWTPEFTILATALITGHFAYKKIFTRQHERK